MTPERMKLFLVLFLAVAMPPVAVWQINILVPHHVLHEHNWAMLALVVFIVVLTWALAFRALGAYREKLSLREARDAEARTGVAAPARDAAMPQTKVSTPRPRRGWRNLTPKTVLIIIGIALFSGAVSLVAAAAIGVLVRSYGGPGTRWAQSIGTWIFLVVASVLIGLFVVPADKDSRKEP